MDQSNLHLFCSQTPDTNSVPCDLDLQASDMILACKTSSCHNYEPVFVIFSLFMCAL